MIYQDAGRLQQQNCQGPGPLLLAAAPIVGPDKPPGGWEEDEDVRKEDRPPHEQLAAGEELQVLVDLILTKQAMKAQLQQDNESRCKGIVRYGLRMGRTLHCWRPRHSRRASKPRSEYSAISSGAVSPCSARI